ncbi:hypothetical protein KL86DES1_20825 [uncultured Desulfovibrio sp.]|uniref:Uncharacterized protein n=1 Tax=uncultured Desulfovibrio sp. TaxID=167968 RepID=A0A212L5G8_9BACT|nr:hypothetical protein KL86DES1_20825 [uncultured Desulfovibrio sp.]
MQMVRQAEPCGITLCSLDQRLFTLKPQAAYVRAHHGKAQQGGPAAAAQFGHKGGARVCRVRPGLFRVFVRLALVRLALIRPRLFRRQVTRGKSGQQKGVRAKAQAALGLLQPARKALPRFDDMLRQGFLHGQSHIRKPGPPRMLMARKYLWVAGIFALCRSSVQDKNKADRYAYCTAPEIRAQRHGVQTVCTPCPAISLDRTTP